MNYLKASTLREMQRVQWHDPESENNWGLSFIITNRNGTMIVAYGGSCPGYRSSVQLDPKTGYGVAVFTNAAGSSPEKFSEGIFKVLNTYASAVAQTTSPDLTGFTGLYDTQVEWGTETAILPWKGKLLLVSLPSNDPIGARPSIYKPTGTPDFFRVDRKDELPGVPIQFEWDAKGKVVGYWVHGNYRSKSAGGK